MDASVQTSQFASVMPIESLSRLLFVPAAVVPAREPRAFPEASTSPALPMTIRDEMVEFYAFIFYQGGFRQAEMTFEQFLLVVAAIKPTDLPATRERTRTFELIPLDAA